MILKLQFHIYILSQTILNVNTFLTNLFKPMIYVKKEAFRLLSQIRFPTMNLASSPYQRMTKAPVL